MCGKVQYQTINSSLVGETGLRDKHNSTGSSALLVDVSGELTDREEPEGAPNETIYLDTSPSHGASCGKLCNEKTGCDQVSNINTNLKLKPQNRKNEKV